MYKVKIKVLINFYESKARTIYQWAGPTKTLYIILLCVCLVISEHEITW